MLEDGRVRMRRLPRHALVTACFPFSIQRRSSWAPLLAVTHLLMEKVYVGGLIVWMGAGLGCP